MFFFVNLDGSHVNIDWIGAGSYHRAVPPFSSRPGELSTRTQEENFVLPFALQSPRRILFGEGLPEENYSRSLQTSTLHLLRKSFANFTSKCSNDRSSVVSLRVFTSIADIKHKIVRTSNINEEIFLFIYMFFAWYLTDKSTSRGNKRIGVFDFFNIHQFIRNRWMKKLVRFIRLHSIVQRTINVCIYKNNFILYTRFMKQHYIRADTTCGTDFFLPTRTNPIIEPGTIRQLIAPQAWFINM